MSPGYHYNDIDVNLYEIYLYFLNAQFKFEQFEIMYVVICIAVILVYHTIGYGVFDLIW